MALGVTLDRLLPKTGMGVFTAGVVLLWAVKSVLFGLGLRQALPASVQAALDLVSLLLVVPAIYYTLRLSGLARRKLLWKIRRRLILAHIFIGAIPVLVVLVIVYVSALLLYYQLSYTLIMNQLGIQIAQIHSFNLTLREGLEAGVASPERWGGAQSILDREEKYLLSAFPSGAVVVRFEDPAGRPRVVAGRNVDPKVADRYRIPEWVRRSEWSGLVSEDFQPDLYRRAPGGGEGGGGLFLRSLASSEGIAGRSFSIEVSVPIDQYLLDRLKAALGLDLLLAHHIPQSGLNVMLQNTGILKRNVRGATFDVGADEGQVGRPVWSVLLGPIAWSSGAEKAASDTEVLFVELSSSKLIQNVFRSESDVSQTILGVLKIVVGFFLGVEGISLLVGIMLTKSITSAVFNLYRGTEFIKRGEFSHRIVVGSDDQLGALARSFNQMTETVQDLVKERVQRERLERELEIAREVQEQLFPRSAPRMERMDLTGLCLPARVVSGDYYDFLQLEPYSMGIALGDICGKGISAALLMANLQATLRSNVVNLARRDGDGFERISSAAGVAEVVKTLNDQIFAYTAANKFASMFYAVYDDHSRSLTYCNAGHNPPLYFTDGGFQRLETGGTVVGIFPNAEFDAARVALSEGDLLLAYTDGIVESVNEYGEEFGEQRLIDIVLGHRDWSAEELQKLIVERVLDWAYEEERDDDMTLLVARFR